MTKQEKIREGIQQKLLIDVANIIFRDRHLDLESKCNVPLAKEILSYLYSQGVVIKVDRELTYYAGLNRFVERGTDKEIQVSAVEPLIEEQGKPCNE